MIKEPKTEWPKRNTEWPVRGDRIKREQKVRRRLPAVPPGTSMRIRRGITPAGNEKLITETVTIIKVKSV